LFFCSGNFQWDKKVRTCLTQQSELQGPLRKCGAPGRVLGARGHNPPVFRALGAFGHGGTMAGTGVGPERHLTAAKYPFQMPVWHGPPTCSRDHHEPRPCAEFWPLKRPPQMPKSRYIEHRVGIKFAPAIKTTQHTQSDPMDPGDTAEGNGGPLLVTGDGLPSTLNKVCVQAWRKLKAMLASERVRGQYCHTHCARARDVEGVPSSMPACLCMSGPRRLCTSRWRGACSAERGAS